MTHAPNYMEAAIRLRIPASGDPKLDAMIREARRLDVATAAMQGIVSAWTAGAGGENDFSVEQTSLDAYEIADAMLSHSEKEQEPTND